MKNKKYLKILIVVISISLLLIFIFSFVKNPSQPPLIRGGVNTEIVSKALSEKNVKVSLTVLGKRYETEIKDGATVFEIMEKVKEENNKFDFKYTEHTGLGIFINEINGLKGGEGGYWIYYVNEKEVSVGVSNYKINNGDIISWRYEE